LHPINSSFLFQSITWSRKIKSGGEELLAAGRSGEAAVQGNPELSSSCRTITANLEPTHFSVFPLYIKCNPLVVWGIDWSVL